jgi:hypothetical protein
MTGALDGFSIMTSFPSHPGEEKPKLVVSRNRSRHTSEILMAASIVDTTDAQHAKIIDRFCCIITQESSEISDARQRMA